MELSETNGRLAVALQECEGGKITQYQILELNSSQIVVEIALCQESAKGAGGNVDVVEPFGAALVFLEFNAIEV